MKTSKFLIFLAILGLFATSCKEDEILLTMESADMQIPAAGGSQILSFNATADWTVSSTQDWVSFNTTSGIAGSVRLTMTIAANTTYETRTAKVSIAAGDKVSVLNITQAMLTTFSATFPYTLDATEQVIEFKMESNYTFNIASDAASWISEVSSKGAPTPSVKYFKIAANKTLKPRTGIISVVADDATFGLIITQNAEFKNLSEAKATCYGRSLKIYDAVNYVYYKYNEFVIELSDSEKGDRVILAVNTADSTLTDVIPQGTFTVDARADHTPNTFSIKPLAGGEEYYTTIYNNDVQTLVEDGEITISYEGDNCVIAAVLMDSHENLLRYSYVGKIDTPVDRTFGGYMEDVGFRDQYFTYFTSKANAWNIGMYISKAPREGALNVSALYMTFFGGCGNVDPQVLPTGTFKFKTAEKDPDSPYANGNYLFDTGDIYSLTAYTDDGNLMWDAEEGSTVTITDNGNGTYTVSFDLALARNIYDENWQLVDVAHDSYNATFPSVALRGEIDTTQYTKPVPDGDMVCHNVMSSKVAGMYFGNYDTFSSLNPPLPWVENTSLLLIGYTSINNLHTLQLTLNCVGWEFEKNFMSRYCNTPLPKATYKFSSTPAANALLPVLVGKTPYCFFENGYTDTKMPITGGEITLGDDSMDINLEVTSSLDHQVYHITGTLPYSLYYIRNMSANAKRISLAK